MAIRLGVVGWGEIAQQHVRSFAAAGAELAAVVSRRDYLVLDVPVYRSLDEMLRQVDVVSVAVPNHLHACTCLAAVDAGKPVMVEKPLLINRTELAQLEAALADPLVPVHVGFRLRWNPSMLRLRARLHNVRRISCAYRLGIDELALDKDWTRDLAITGGSFFTLGVHTLDLARWLAGCRGEPLADVSASADAQSSSADYPLRVSLRGTLPSGIEIIAGADLSVERASTMDLRVEAERGAYPDPELPPPTFQDEPVEYTALIGHFVRAVKTGTIDASECREVLQTHRELLDAREQSHPGGPH